ncbi:hypothetical protein AYL99_02763 [Fonsecaea erecta]|uniref:RRM domain-containing protein n=1 Tax=Fonsecaea erecta TaxID=1367422 RepID=A0A178ZVT1_9EURO|nr:hypothetical protein AYL99_02763 [Fonsecaea erecta]OAP63536.1 hypothetical protein AYL99_02763 [Fonsecaea erecta]
MDGLLEPIKTTRKVQNNIDKFETLTLKDSVPASRRPASTKSKISVLDTTTDASDDASDAFSLRPSVDTSISQTSAEAQQTNHKRHDSTAFLQKSYLDKAPPASLPDDALEILKDQPNNEDLAAVLEYLHYGIEGRHDFNIHVPEPKASQIINVLVTVTVPDQWLHLRKPRLSRSDTQLKTALLSSLSSVAGIGALLMQIRRLSSINPGQDSSLLADTVHVLSSVLAGNTIISKFLSHAIKTIPTDTQRRVFWQEATSQLAGSKILTTMSQVFATFRDLKGLGEHEEWLGDGNEYSRWLGRNISTAAASFNTMPPSNSPQISLLCQMLKRGLSLGYRDTLISELYNSLLLGKRALWTPMHILIQGLPAYDQKVLFDTILRDLARRFFENGADIVGPKELLETNSSTIGGVAAMINGLVRNNPLLEAHVTNWLTSTNGEYAGLGLNTRRAVIATLAASQDKLEQILERSLENFGNKLQIQRDAILQQESEPVLTHGWALLATAQTILLAFGYLNRLDHSSVKKFSGSSAFVRAVSNRLSASVPRARLLGMMVAVAVSKLVDQPDKILNFGIEEMEGEQMQRFVGLVDIQDTIGSLEQLVKNAIEPSKKRPLHTTPKAVRRKRLSTEPRPQGSKIVAIEEVSDSDGAPSAGEEEEEEDLQPYPLPDSDPSDSDDDPTLVNRNKPAPPVYITSLIKQLNAKNDPSAVELAIKTAPSLIRRKANFGDELSSNILQLASSLVNVQEGMDSDDVQRSRLEGIIACLVSIPRLMGPWIVSMYFEGDFSLSTRATLLTAVSLGSRELAGINIDVDRPSATERPSEPPFPSNRLPPRLEPVYSSPAAVDTITTALSYRTLQPLALEAADKLTGPDILKVRTFSSRMKVAAKTAAKLEARSKRIPKDLHKLLAEALYLPFCSRLTLLLASLVTSPYLVNSTLLHPSLIKLSLQTLIILISTIGPNAVQLPTLTHESLLLLTTLHTLPSLAHDAIILPPILHLILTLLDLNIEAGSTSEERLVTDFGPMFAELVSWTSSLGDRVSIPEVDGDPGLGMAMPWPVLVAGIQVKWQEVGRKFQGRMYALRRCASRFLTSQPSIVVSSSRTYTSISAPTSRLIGRAAASFPLQRRWATGGTQEKESKPPISGIEPTKSEEAENAAQTQASSTKSAPQAAEPANITEATEESFPAAVINENLLAETGPAPTGSEPAIAESANATEATDEALPAAETGEKLTADSKSTPSQSATLSHAGMFDRKPTLYIGNLFFDVTETDLVKEFARFGTVTKCKIVRDSRGLSKGFGYVDFSTQEAADAAMERLNMSLFEGRRITVQYAARPSGVLDNQNVERKPLNPPSKTLFIGNMSFEMTDRDLTNLFRGIRNVIDVRVAIDRRTGQPRGFAHADFIDVKSAMEAMKLLQEKEIYGRRLRVDFSYSSANRAPRNDPPVENN